MFKTGSKKQANKQYKKITKISKQDKYKDELLDFENPKAHKLILSTKIMKIPARFGKTKIMPILTFEIWSIFDFCEFLMDPTD